MSEYRITKQELQTWCSLPADALPGHPDRHADLVIDADKARLNAMMCDRLADEVIANNAAGRPTRWILPCHRSMFDHLTDRINAERISMANVHIFHMDDFLDWQARPYPVKPAFTSCKGTMLSQLYERIAPELNVPENQRHFPDYRDPDALDEAIEAAGGVDTLVGGVGCKGLVAFCEAPQSPYYRVSLEEYRDSKTRIVAVHDDTVVAYAERDFGGCYDAVPPMAITIGMRSMLRAKRAMFVVATGAWKQTVIRVALFSKPTTEYPVTLLTNDISDCTIFTNPESVDHIMSHKAPLDTLKE